MIGGDNPVVIQSMTNTSTLDTAASAIQIKAIADAGAGLVRLTTQGVREAANLKAIREEAARLGCRVAVSADVHFNPKAAFEAALHADKVRINPGNFVDAARTFRTLECCGNRQDQAYVCSLPLTVCGEEMRGAYRGEPWVALRQDNEQIRKFRTRHGGVRYGIPEDSAGGGFQ